MQKIDTETIIVNLLKEDKKTYLSIKRLQKLLVFIYDELSKQNELDKYNIYFDVNFDAIERTILYNNNIFKLDIDGDMIYLREKNDVDDLAEQFKTDRKIKTIINNFIKMTAA